MALIAPAHTGTPVHEPAHGGPGITAMWATERDRDGRRMARLAAPRWPSPGLSLSRPEVPRYIPYYDSYDPDA